MNARVYIGQEHRRIVWIEPKETSGKSDNIIHFFPDLNGKSTIEQHKARLS